jgi:hypothetical protein
MKWIALAGGFVGGLVLAFFGTWAWLVREFHFK